MSPPLYWLSASVLTMMSAPCYDTCFQPGSKGACQAHVVGEADHVVDADGFGYRDRLVGAAVIDDQIFDDIDAVQLARQGGDGLRQRLLFIEARYLYDQFHNLPVACDQPLSLVR